MKNVFLRFLFTYIIILLLPIILGWTIYELVLREFESYITSTHISLLSQTSEIIDRYTKEIEWRVFHIANNKKLKDLMYQYSGKIEDNILLIREIVNELTDYVIYSSSYNTTFYIYLKNFDLIITPNASYTLKDFIQEDVFFQIEGMTSKEWHDYIISKYYPGRFLKAKKMTIEDIGKFEMDRMIPYIQSLPLGYSKLLEDITGVILFFTMEEEFTNLLANLNIPEGGWAYIEDENKNIFTGISNNSEIVPVDISGIKKEGLTKINISGKDMFVIHTTSLLNNWQYTAVLPTRFVLDKIKIIQVISLAAVIVTIAFGIILSTFIAYRRAKPIKKIIGLLKETYETGTQRNLSRMDELSGSISRLIEKNRDMHVQLKEQIRFVRAAFFNNLLNGYFRNEKEMNSFLFYSGISISGKRYIVLLLNLTGYESLASTEIIGELVQVKVIVRNTLKQTFSEKSLLHDIDERKIAAIVPLEYILDEDCINYVDEKIAIFENEFSKYYKGIVQIGIGNICSSLLGINNSFEQAKEALNYIEKHENGYTAWFRDTYKQSVEYYFPLELEMRLLHSTKAGDRKQVDAIIDTIYSENMKKRSLEAVKLQELFFEMQGTLIKVASHIALKDINVKIDLDKPFEQVFNKLKIIYIEICEQVNHRKKSHNKILITKIKDYLKDKYNDTNLSLYRVSSLFSISESYLSYFFKEQTGTNFSFFLEKLRIDHAVKLLENPQLSIKKIARLVGYNSDKTFRRVFKRARGMSPSSYRQEKNNI